MKLRVYVDRMSQPSRAVLIFCKVNGIEFEEIKVELLKGQQLSPEFKEINPFKKVPAIVDGRFKLSEGHAILIYLACAFPGVADHWYPADVSRRAKINSVLDWHHLNLRSGAAKYVLNSVLAPLFGRPLNLQAAVEAEKLLSLSLSKIENIWLNGNGPFLLGGSQPSIADLSLVCEVMQLEGYAGRILIPCPVESGVMTFFSFSFYMRRIVVEFLARTRKFSNGLRTREMQQDLTLMKFIISSIRSKGYLCGNQTKEKTRLNPARKLDSLQRCNNVLVSASHKFVQ